MGGHYIQVNKWKFYSTLTITFFCFQYTSVFIVHTFSDHTLIPNISTPWAALFWKLPFPSAKMTHHQHAAFSRGEPTGRFIWNFHTVTAFSELSLKAELLMGKQLNSCLPFSSTASTLAPFPKSSWTTTVSPFRAATCRGLWRQTNW